MPLRLFRPVLAGARLPERRVACLGALPGIAPTMPPCGRLRFREDPDPLLARAELHAVVRRIGQ